MFNACDELLDTDDIQAQDSVLHWFENSKDDFTDTKTQPGTMQVMKRVVALRN